MNDRKKTEFTLEAFAQAEHWAWMAYKEYQVAQDDLDILKDAQKDVLAIAMCAVVLNPPDASEAKLERLARCSEAWKDHKRGYEAAIRKRGESKMRYDSAVRLWETCQTGISYKKIELSKLGTL